MLFKHLQKLLDIHINYLPYLAYCYQIYNFFVLIFFKNKNLHVCMVQILVIINSSQVANLKHTIYEISLAYLFLSSATLVPYNYGS